MADEYNNEVFMRLVLASGAPISAECRTEVTTDGDDLVSEYYNGEFFAVDDYTFGLNVVDEDTTPGSGLGALGKDHSSSAALKPKANAGQFGRWKSAAAADIKAMKFQLHVNDLTIIRRYDRASPVLFDMCSKCISLKSASLVKRKVTGDDMLQGFLRFDFGELLIKSISFQDAEVIKETIQFNFRKVMIRYLPQNPDGSLGATMQTSWDFDAQKRTGPSK